MKISGFVIVVISMLAVTACTPEPSKNLQKSIVESSAISDFDPGNGVIPFPNDVLFSGTLDGTVNIPVINPADLSDPQVALNSLDGFSTIAPIVTGFTGPINPASINGNSVRFYKVTLTPNPLPHNQGGAVAAIDSTLTFGVDYTAGISPVDSSQSTLAIVPLKPLDAKSSYFVVITNELQSSDGNPMGASGAFTLARLSTPLQVGGFSQFPNVLSDAEAIALEPLRQLVNFSLNTLVAFDSSLAINDVVISWSFTTQTIGATLDAVRAAAPTPGTTLASSAIDLGGGVGKTPLGAANLFVGSLDGIPYYLTAPTVDPTVILNNPWKAIGTVGGENNLTEVNPMPASTGNIDVPIMVSTPTNTILFPAPWKTVIFQHGITRNRADMLAVADTLASVGFATVAIDMPLHGLNGTSPLYQMGLERTFDTDLVGQDESGNIISTGPDGFPDSSGLHFINLQNLQVSRDNLRQAVADLFALAKAIPGIDVDGGGGDLNGSEIYFVGHSLGAIVGVPFTSREANVKDAVLANGGGGIPKILDGSANFSPAVVAGLAAAGVSKGTVDYESFLGAAQTVVDTADPMNYATELTTKGEGILFFEVVGGNSSPSDLTVPIRVPDGNDSSNTVPAPLAGTEPLLAQLGLTQINSTTTGANLLISVKFTAGTHGSILDPTSSAAVTTAMQSQLASFLASSGAQVTVSDPGSVIQSP